LRNIYAHIFTYVLQFTRYFLIFVCILPYIILYKLICILRATITCYNASAEDRRSTAFSRSLRLLCISQRNGSRFHRSQPNLTEFRSVRSLSFCFGLLYCVRGRQKIIFLLNVYVLNSFLGTKCLLSSLSKKIPCRINCSFYYEAVQKIKFC
jgi:hypothetical protein